MPLDNLNNVHYTADEKAAVKSALTILEAALKDKFRNLSAEERKRYGSINEQNKLVVNKVFDFRNNKPDLSSPQIDWNEFQNDYESRAFLQDGIARLQDIIDGLINNKTLHDYDNYQAALTDYGYSQYMAGTKEAGYENKMNELGQFFNRSTTGASIENPK